MKPRYSLRTLIRSFLTLAIGLLLISCTVLFISSPPSSPTSLPAITFSSNQKQQTISPLLRHLSLSPEQLYTTLLTNHPTPSTAVVFEVGAHRLAQTLQSATLGFETFAFDASPRNFAEIVSCCQNLLPKCHKCDKKGRLKLFWMTVYSFESRWPQAKCFFVRNVKATIRYTN